MNSKKIRKEYVGTERNQVFDLLKLYAMCSVVLDHSLKRWIYGIQSTQLYNFIFLSQMPIFMFIAGYFFYNNFKKEYSKEEIMKKAKKIIVSFLIPFTSFSIVTSIISNDFSRIIVNLVESFLIPDNSLWFLWTLMWIEILMLCAQFLGKQVDIKNDRWDTKKLVISGCIFLLLLIPVAVLYFKFPQYFETKLIIYYSLFFVFGFICRHLTLMYNIDNKVIRSIGFVCSFIGIVIVMKEHPNILNDAENITNMGIRVVGSVCCIVFIWNVAKLLIRFKCVAKCSMLGAYSLELYYMHLVLFAFPETHNYLNFSNFMLGIVTYIILYVTTIITSFLLIFIIKKNRILNFVIFGKKEVIKNEN